MTETIEVTLRYSPANSYYSTRIAKTFPIGTDISDVLGEMSASHLAEWLEGYGVIGEWKDSGKLESGKCYSVMSRCISKTEAYFRGKK